MKTVFFLSFFFILFSLSPLFLFFFLQPGMDVTFKSKEPIYQGREGNERNEWNWNWNRNRNNEAMRNGLLAHDDRRVPLTILPVSPFFIMR